MTVAHIVNVKQLHLKKMIASSNIFFPFLSYLAFVWNIFKLIYRKAKGDSNPLIFSKPRENVRMSDAAAPTLDSVKEL